MCKRGDGHFFDRGWWHDCTPCEGYCHAAQARSESDRSTGRASRRIRRGPTPSPPAPRLPSMQHVDSVYACTCSTLIRRACSWLMQHRLAARSESSALHACALRRRRIRTAVLRGSARPIFVPRAALLTTAALASRPITPCSAHRHGIPQAMLRDQSHGWPILLVQLSSNSARVGGAWASRSCFPAAMANRSAQRP